MRDKSRHKCVVPGFQLECEIPDVEEGMCKRMDKSPRTMLCEEESADECRESKEGLEGVLTIRNTQTLTSSRPVHQLRRSKRLFKRQSDQSTTREPVECTPVTRCLARSQEVVDEHEEKKRVEFAEGERLTYRKWPCTESAST